MVKKTSSKKGAAARSTRSETGEHPRARQEARPAEPVRIGVLSDTHGYLDPVVLELFAGVRHIIHAGDVMDAEILRRLEAVAPVTAVAGNLDDPRVTGALHLNPGTASSPEEEEEEEEEEDGPTVAVVERAPTGLGVRFLPLARRRD